jgi:hypothetical protein
MTDKTSGSFQFVLDLLQFQEGFHGCQAIDVCFFQQFPDALKGFGMGVENGKLHLGRVDLPEGRVDW